MVNRRAVVFEMDCGDRLAIRIALILILLMLSWTPSAWAQKVEPSIELVRNQNRDVFLAKASWISELKKGTSKLESSELAKRFFVKVVSESGINETPLMARIEMADQGLILIPRFPVKPGVQYQAFLFDSKASTQLKSVRLSLPNPAASVARITGVFPSADRLPENLLKFYVTFASPMSQGDIYKYLSIREKEGKAIELPFLEIEQELWSPDGRRVTLLLDPGRIKRGLKPREEMGPILKAGQAYELVISGDWQNARGRQLGKDYIKSFKAIANDDQLPDPSKWTLKLPKSGTRQVLEIDLDESLDYGMLHRVISVETADGKNFGTAVQVGKHEKSLRLKPDFAWKSGRYQLVVDSQLEDLCGNNIQKAFDVDVFDKTERSQTKLTRIPFAIK